MVSGGARVRSGPAPDPNALARERDAGEWIELPASGRPGEPPVWPLAAASEREMELWARFWATPQALMWERLGQDFEVALYVRRLGELEQPKSPIALGTLVRQMADSLGLTTPGMRANRWKLNTSATVAAADAPSAPVAPRVSSRARFAVVPGGDAA